VACSRRPTKSQNPTCCGCSQLRLLQEAIKREEDYLAEERRREIQARAEADEDAKCAYYLAKQEEREMRLQQRQQQAELLRMLRAEEAQARFEYIRSRAAEVGERDRAKREELSRKLEVRGRGCWPTHGARYSCQRSVYERLDQSAAKYAIHCCQHALPALQGLMNLQAT
jgi:hypothetical protein